MNIKKLIEKSKKGKLYKNGRRHIFTSDYSEWIKEVESYVNHIRDGEKFFTDTDEKGVIRAFFKNEKVGVWGGVSGNGYYIPVLKVKRGNGDYNKGADSVFR